MPTCGFPVGDGQNRTRTDGSAPALTPPPGSASVPTPPMVTSTTSPVDDRPDAGGRTGQQHVAGQQGHHRADVRHQLGDRVQHVAGPALLAHLAAHPALDAQRRSGPARSRSTVPAGRTCRTPWPGPTGRPSAAGRGRSRRCRRCSRGRPRGPARSAPRGPGGRSRPRARPRGAPRRSARGSRTGSPGPTTAVDGLRKMTGSAGASPPISRACVRVVLPDADDLARHHRGEQPDVARAGSGPPTARTDRTGARRSRSRARRPGCRPRSGLGVAVDDAERDLVGDGEAGDAHARQATRRRRPLRRPGPPAAARRRPRPPAPSTTRR